MSFFDTMKTGMLLIFGIVISIIGIVLAIILKIYSIVLEMIIHPSKICGEIVNYIGNFQDWIDKKTNGQ